MAERPTRIHMSKCHWKGMKIYKKKKTSSTTTTTICKWLIYITNLIYITDIDVIDAKIN